MSCSRASNTVPYLRFQSSWSIYRVDNLLTAPILEAVAALNHLKRAPTKQCSSPFSDCRPGCRAALLCSIRGLISSTGRLVPAECTPSLQTWRVVGLPCGWRSGDMSRSPDWSDGREKHVQATHTQAVMVCCTRRNGSLPWS